MIGTIFCSHSLINGARLVSFFLQTRFFVRVSPRVVLPVQNVEYHPSNESGPPYPQDIIGGLPTRKHLPPSTYLRLELFSLATKIEKPLARFMPKKGNWVRTFFFSMSYILQDTTLIRSKTSDLLEALVLEVPCRSTNVAFPWALALHIRFHIWERKPGDGKCNLQAIILNGDQCRRNGHSSC